MKKIIVLVFCFIFNIAVGVDIGSYTGVTRFQTQQVASDGDVFAGFSRFEEGIAIDRATSNVTWDAYFAVTGSTELNLGTLTLNQDLIFENIAEMTTLGNIVGNCHVVSLAPKMVCFPVRFPLCNISSLAPGGLVEFANASQAVNTVNWSYDSEYVVIGTSRVGAVGNIDLYVYSWDGTTLTQEASAVVGIGNGQDVTGVSWHPSKDWIAVTALDGAGNNDTIFTYTFNRSTPALALLDSSNPGSNIDALAVEWDPIGDFIAVGTTDAAAELQVYPVNSITGVIGTAATGNAGATVNTVRWNNDGSFIAIGTNTSSAEIEVWNFATTPAVTLNATIGASVGVVNGISWCKDSYPNVIAAALQSGADRSRVYEFTSGSPGTIIEIDRINSGNPVFNIDFNPECTCIVLGTQSTGAPEGELQSLQYNGVTQQLIARDNDQLSRDVNSVRWSLDSRYLAAGTGSSPNSVVIYRLDSEFGDFSTVNFTDVNLVLNGDVHFHDLTIKWFGTNSIDGKGNNIIFDGDDFFNLGSNSSLLFKDVFIKGISGNQLTAVDSTSTYSFAYATWLLGESYSFTVGKIDVIDEWKIIGEGHSFVYQSESPLTIKNGLREDPQTCDSRYDYGVLYLDSGVTFSYDVLNPNLLVLENEDSKIVMNSATLAVTSSLHLTRGILQIDGKSIFESADGIIFGDCTTAGNVSIELLPAANLCVNSGELIYNNIL